MSLRGSAILQQAYTTALWYLSCVMPVGHTDQNSLEAVTKQREQYNHCIVRQEQACCSLETAQDCSATVSNNRANSSVTVELSASGLVIEEHKRECIGQCEHRIVWQQEQACSQFGDCKRLFDNSLRQKSRQQFDNCKQNQFGNCIRQREQWDDCIVRQSQQAC